MLRHQSRELQLAKALYLLSEGQPFRQGVYAAFVQTAPQDRAYLQEWIQRGWWTAEHHWTEGAFTAHGITYFTVIFQKQGITIDTVT